MNENEKKLIEEFAEYLSMSFDKGMRMSVAMCKNNVEKFKIKSIYTQFLNAIPECVESFEKWKEFVKDKE